MIQTLASLALDSGTDIFAQEQQRASIENPRTPLAAIFDLEPTYSGVRVNQRSATSLAAFYRAVTLVAGDFARLPLLPYFEDDQGELTLAKSHYLYPLLTSHVNERMSTFRFKRLMQTWVGLHGNAFAAIDFNGRAQVLGLYPMQPDHVRMETSPDGQVYYKFTSLDGRKEITLSWEVVLHVRGPELGGDDMGENPIQNFRNALGLALAVEEQQARFFSNGARPSGILTVPTVLSEEVRSRNKKAFAESYAGLSNAHKTILLEGGVDYKPLTMSSKDSEIIASRDFSVAEVSRMTGVPMHKLALLGDATLNNIEHLGIEYLTDCLSHHTSNWEAELSMALLSERERTRLKLKTNFDDLLLADQRSTMEAIQLARKNGMTINEARKRMRLGRVDGGDEPMVQVQDVPLSQAGKTLTAGGGTNGQAA